MRSRVRELIEHPAWPLGNILDLRPTARFRAGHWRGAVSLPLEESADWPGPDGLQGAYLDAALPSIFLPSRHQPLVVVASASATARAVCELLARRGRSGLLPLASAAGTEADLPASLSARGASSGHLWQPPPFLRRHLQLLPPPPLGGVLDLACGSGRAAVWLARRGYRVTAVDWQAEALALGERLADNSAVQCHFLRADLRDLARLPAGRWAIVLVLRYLQRDLFARLGNLLLPGGVALIRTFRHVDGYRGSPRPRFRLGRAELPRYFPPDRFTSLVHEENFTADGRPAAGIIVRRRIP